MAILTVQCLSELLLFPLVQVSQCKELSWRSRYVFLLSFSLYSLYRGHFVISKFTCGSVLCKGRKLCNTYKLSR
jgi:hypothetical protein